MESISTIISWVLISLFIVLTLYINIWVLMPILKSNDDKDLEVSHKGIIISSIKIIKYIIWLSYLCGVLPGIILPNILTVPIVPAIIISIGTALYASSVFAVLVTSFVNARLVNQLQDIKNQIGVLNNQDLFRPSQVFDKNWQEKPNKDFYKELVESILNSKKYIYEGEKARTASM